MAGHSKWANIKHKKAAQDKKRGKVFTKLLKEVTVAAKLGDDDESANPRLRAAVQAAKAQNVPKDNIERAIKKATGADAADYVELTYECYGPGGVAIFVEAASDNQTRTVANVRSILNKMGGSLGKDGCLQFLFDQKASFLFSTDQVKDEETITLELIDAGAEDVEKEQDQFLVTGPMESFGSIQQKLDEFNINCEESGLERIPTTLKEVDKDLFGQNVKVIDALEEDDDIQKVYHNMDVQESFYE